MSVFYTDDARRVKSVAHRHAVKLHRDAVGVEHLALAMIEYGRGSVEEAFFALDVTPGEAWKQLELLAVARPVADSIEEPHSLPYTAGASRVLGLAFEEKRKLHDDYIGCEHILLALLRHLDDAWAEPELAAELLARLGVDLRRLRQELMSRIPVDTDRPAKKSTDSIGGLGSMSQILFWAGGDS